MQKKTRKILLGLTLGLASLATVVTLPLALTSCHSNDTSSATNSNKLEGTEKAADLLVGELIKVSVKDFLNTYKVHSENEYQLTADPAGVEPQTLTSIASNFQTQVSARINHTILEYLNSYLKKHNGEKTQDKSLSNMSDSDKSKIKAWFEHLKNKFDDWKDNVDNDIKNIALQIQENFPVTVIPYSSNDTIVLSIANTLNPNHAVLKSTIIHVPAVNITRR